MSLVETVLGLDPPVSDLPVFVLDTLLSVISPSELALDPNDCKTAELIV